MTPDPDREKRRKQDEPEVGEQPEKLDPRSRRLASVEVPAFPTRPDSLEKAPQGPFGRTAEDLAKIKHPGAKVALAGPVIAAEIAREALLRTTNSDYIQKNDHDRAVRTAKKERKRADIFNKALLDYQNTVWTADSGQAAADLRNTLSRISPTVQPFVLPGVSVGDRIESAARILGLRNPGNDVRRVVEGCPKPAERALGFTAIALGARKLAAWETQQAVDKKINADGNQYVDPNYRPDRVSDKLSLDLQQAGELSAKIAALPNGHIKQIYADALREERERADKPRSSSNDGQQLDGTQPEINHLKVLRSVAAKIDGSASENPDVQTRVVRSQIKKFEKEQAAKLEEQLRVLREKEAVVRKRHTLDVKSLAELMEMATGSGRKGELARSYLSELAKHVPDDVERGYVESITKVYGPHENGIALSRNKLLRQVLQSIPGDGVADEFVASGYIAGGLPAVAQIDRKTSVGPQSKFLAEVLTDPGDAAIITTAFSDEIFPSILVGKEDGKISHRHPLMPPSTLNAIASVPVNSMELALISLMLDGKSDGLRGFLARQRSDILRGSLRDTDEFVLGIVAACQQVENAAPLPVPALAEILGDHVGKLVAPVLNQAAKQEVNLTREGAIDTKQMGSAAAVLASAIMKTAPSLAAVRAIHSPSIKEIMKIPAADALRTSPIVSVVTAPMANPEVRNNLDAHASFTHTAGKFLTKVSKALIPADRAEGVDGIVSPKGILDDKIYGMLEKALRALPQDSHCLIPGVVTIQLNESVNKIPGVLGGVEGNIEDINPPRLHKSVEQAGLGLRSEVPLTQQLAVAAIIAFIQAEFTDKITVNADAIKSTDALHTVLSDTISKSYRDGGGFQDIEGGVNPQQVARELETAAVHLRNLNSRLALTAASYLDVRKAMATLARAVGLQTTEVSLEDTPARKVSEISLARTTVTGNEGRDRKLLGFINSDSRFSTVDRDTARRLGPIHVISQKYSLGPNGEPLSGYTTEQLRALSEDIRKLNAAK